MTNKWFGKVGFGVQAYDEEKRRTVNTVVEHQYYGDIINVFHSQQAYQTDSVNANPRINNKISIVMDAFATEHFSTIRYVEFMGVLFNVIDVSVEPPRLVLTMGGVCKNAKSN